RAYVYFDRAHGFARDYILTHGTDVTDYEVGQATTTWINDILYSELDLKNGAIHHGVASGIGIGCRVGPLTAFPHPNQPLFNRIGRDMALQVEGGAAIGGYGGGDCRACGMPGGSGNSAAHTRPPWEEIRHTCHAPV